MVRALVLMLCALAAGGAARVSTRCASDACVTLHLEEEPFEKAHEICFKNGGNLVTMRNDNELEQVRSALSASGEPAVLKAKVWIGLMLLKGICTDIGDQLHGFQWTSEPKDAKYSNWRMRPLSTCTEKRCVSVSLVDDVKWTDGSCRDSAFYMCRFRFKGTCRPIELEKPSDVKYDLPFLSTALSQEDGLTVLPHGTLAEIQCGGSDDPFISLCDNKHGIFDWTNQQRFCARDKRSCRHKNGGCDHICSDSDGNVRCECREGFDLMDDKVTCAVRNTCDHSPCQSTCVSTSSGFTCACTDGFQLAGDKISCEDVDECREHICGEHVCVNSPGGYSCECKSGFRRVAGKCEDVDECDEDRCDQGCLNSHGSFSCYCHTGYSAADNGSCVDIDECLSRPCEDTCINTLGSFRCSCRKNFTLDTNGISCIPEPTKRPQTTSQDLKEASITTLNQSPEGFEPSTIDPSSPESPVNTDSSKRADGPLGISWVLLCVLGSVVPMILLIVVTSVFVIYRWKRSRKTTKKNATADNYCWVSSGFDNLEKQQR